MELVKVAFRQPYNAKYLTEDNSFVFASHEKVKVDDYVVVETQYGFSLGVVVGIMEQLPSHVKPGQLKEVVCVVNFSKFNKRKERLQRLKDLKFEMNKKVKLHQEQQVYELIAEKDPEMAKLLKEYNKLEGSI